MRCFCFLFLFLKYCLAVGNEMELYCLKNCTLKYQEFYGSFFSYHDARKIDYNWKIAFIHLESSETFIICISLLIMRLWGLTFHLEMRESNHEFIFLHISARLRTAWRRKQYRGFQTYGIWDALPPFNLKDWTLRLCFLLRLLFWGQTDQHVLHPWPSLRVGFYPEAKLLQSPGLKINHLYMLNVP